MGLFTMEHGKVAYRADFALYGTAVVALAAIVVVAGPQELRLDSLALALLGLVGWTVIE